MEKNTLLLDIEEYNQLRDFRKKIIEDYTYEIQLNGFHDNKLFITKDNAIKELAMVNEKLQQEIEELKKMSIWQFIKWKRH